MAEYENGAGEDTILEMQAVIDLVDANVAPLETTNEWRRAIAYAEGENQADRVQTSAITAIIDDIGEQA